MAGTSRTGRVSARHEQRAALRAAVTPAAAAACSSRRPARPRHASSARSRGTRGGAARAAAASAAGSRVRAVCAEHTRTSRASQRATRPSCERCMSSVVRVSCRSDGPTCVPSDVMRRRHGRLRSAIFESFDGMCVARVYLEPLAAVMGVLRPPCRPCSSLDALRAAPAPVSIWIVGAVGKLRAARRRLRLGRAG